MDHKACEVCNSEEKVVKHYVIPRGIGSIGSDGSCVIINPKPGSVEEVGNIEFLCEKCHKLVHNPEYRHKKWMEFIEIFKDSDLVPEKYKDVTTVIDNAFHFWITDQMSQ